MRRPVRLPAVQAVGIAQIRFDLLVNRIVVAESGAAPRLSHQRVELVAKTEAVGRTFHAEVARGLAGEKAVAKESPYCLEHLHPAISVAGFHHAHERSRSGRS